MREIAYDEDGKVIRGTDAYLNNPDLKKELEKQFECPAPEVRLFDRDNPHAKGLSVNEDWIGEDCSITKITITDLDGNNPVYLYPGYNFKAPDGPIVADRYERQVFIPFHSPEYMNYRSGLALTNPEE